MPETTEVITTKSSKVKVLLKGLGVVVLSVIIYLGAAVATGFISAFSNNIETGTFNIIFDSQITIAYLMLYYTLSHFLKMSEKQNYFLFVTTLLLSFTTNFIQGAITLLILPSLLKKIGLIKSEN